MAEPITADFHEPDDQPGFDLDDAAIAVCILLIPAGLIGTVIVLTAMIVGG